MANEPTYFDLTIRGQVRLERVKSAEVRDFLKLYPKLERQIRRAIGDLNKDFSELTKRELREFIALIRDEQTALYVSAVENYLSDANKIAALSLNQEVLNLQRTVDLSDTSLRVFTRKQTFSKVANRPMSANGKLLQSYIDDMTKTEIKRINNTISQGWVQGETNQQITQRLIGTKARNYKDGILDTSRRNAETIVRTATQHVSNTARQELWEANTDVLNGYEYLATLDRKTSVKCRSLDGKKFEFGKGPIPPIHPRCRSTTVPLLNEKYSFLEGGGTRSAEFGPVKEETTYYEWLKRQNKDVQVEALGPKRAKLFRDGGLSAEKFSELQFDKNFDPLTLDDMRELEPEAFEKAGL